MASHAQHGHSGHNAHVSGPAWLPVALAILLGSAAMVAGLIAWRAAGHSGDAQKELALSTQADNNANSLQQAASQAVVSERSLFVAYEDVYDQGIEDMLHRIPSLAKIRDAIGWTPSHDLESILHDVVEYARSGPVTAETR